MSPLDRIDAIIMANDDDDHIELMEISARLLPILREWLDARIQYQTATATPEHECARRVEDACRNLARALRGDP